MTINLNELRKTVENAGEAWADGEHIDIITPAVVRELIEEIESLRTRFKGMRASRDSERSRADKNAHKLEQAEQLARINNQAMLEQAQRAGQAEQAVQRVQELAEEFDKHDYPRGIHRFSVAKRIRRALDGDQA